MTDTVNTEMLYSELPVEDNITLRQLKPEEAEAIFLLIDNDRQYLSKWLQWVNSTRTPEDSGKFIAETIRKRHGRSEYGYAICVNGVPVGHMSLMHTNDDTKPEIGYWLSKGMAGRGITTKAARALTNFGLYTLGLERIVIRANPENTASNKVAEKLGYIMEETKYADDLKETVNVWSITADADKAS